MTRPVAVVPLDDPAPIAWRDLYDEGDVWEKTRGCDECPEEWRAKCCKGCVAYVPEIGCAMHRPRTKPFECILLPAPHKCRRNCVLEFVCIEGPKKGWVRKVTDSNDVLVAP